LERRRHPRLPLRIPVEIRGWEGKLVADTETADISAGGLYALLEGRTEVEEMMDVAVCLRLPSDYVPGPVSLAMQLSGGGSVVRMDVTGKGGRPGIAIQFQAPLQITRLTTL
jgi:hypothetical protein